MPVPPRNRIRRLTCGALLCSITFTAACATTPAPPRDVAPVPAPATAAVPAFVDSAIAALRARHAPDRRVARFDIEARSENGALVLSGETTNAAARAALVRTLASRGVAFTDRVLVLPDSALGELRWGIANNSVANLRTVPGHSSELSTQVLLGTPLRLLRRQNGFYLAQVPDGYLSWVDDAGIQRVSDAELQRYRAAPRVIFIRTVGAALSAPRADAEPVIDLVLGAVLERTPAADAAGWSGVRLPDGRAAFVQHDAVAAWDEWVARTQATEEGLVRVARSLMGLPYLWGGTSAKGVDCSGFTKTVYLMNGLVLPRDASQQVHVGTLVDDAGDFSRLRPGDLLFFGRRAADGVPERAGHVGMWIGDGRFIHSSGRVLINSVDPAAPDYDAYNVERYLRTKRVLGSTNGVLALRDDALFTFQAQEP